MATIRRVNKTVPKKKGKILLGAIADDIAGATDLCYTLVGQGMRTIQEIGIPQKDKVVRDADAVVIALNTRTAPPKMRYANLLRRFVGYRHAVRNRYILNTVRLSIPPTGAISGPSPMRFSTPWEKTSQSSVRHFQAPGVPCFKVTFSSANSCSPVHSCAPIQRHR